MNNFSVISRMSVENFTFGTQLMVCVYDSECRHDIDDEEYKEFLAIHKVQLV